MSSSESPYNNEKVIVTDQLFTHSSTLRQMRDPLKTLWNKDLTEQTQSEAEQLLKSIDFSPMNNLFDNFLAAIGLPVAIIDPTGAVLASSKWQRLCVEFHRANSGTLARCLESDRSIYAQLQAGKSYALHQCDNGLCDCAAPIIVEGHHIANLFIGQFFTSQPNIDFFKRQQQQFGFDETLYFAAIAEVPVINEEKLPAIVALLVSWARQIADHSLIEKRTLATLSSIEQQIKERTEELNKSHALLQTAQIAARMGHYVTDLITGTWTNDWLFNEIFGIDKQFTRDFTHWQQILHPDDVQRVMACFEQHVNNREQFPSIEYRIIRPSDGKLCWIAAWGHNFYDNEGNAVQQVGMIQDITERKQSEKLLLNSENRYRTLVELASDAIFLADADSGTLIDCNKNAVELLGKTKNEIIGLHQAELHPFDKREFYSQLFKEHIISGNGIVENIFIVHKEGHTIPVDIHANAFELDGRLVMMGIFHDVTERKHAEQQLQKSKEQLQLVLKGGDLGFWDWNIVTNEVERNAIWAEMLGYTHEEIKQTTQQWMDFIYPDDRNKAWQSIADTLAGHTPYHEVEYRMLHKEGYIVWILDHASIVQRDINGQPTRMSGIHINISKQKRMEEQLRASENFFSSLAQINPVGIYRTDAQGNCIYVNDKASEIIGMTAQEASNDGWLNAIMKDDREKVHQEWFLAVQEQRKFTMEYRMQQPSGYIVWVYGLATAIYDEAGAISGYVGTITDINDRKAIEERINHLAFYDSLTHLPNRRLLYERLKHGIELNHRTASQMAVLMLDLDKFKAVNDTLGHAAGDELLQQVATRMKQHLREVDMVARLGGDEVVVVMDDVLDYQQVARVAEELIHLLTQPFALCHSHDVHIGASIGIAIHPQHGGSVEALVDNADAALYHAKDSGRGCFSYFSEELTQAARERLALEARLRRALAQQELRVFFQPQVDMNSGQIIGAEALIRWRDPVKGYIMPNEFIALAEETGLIIQIGEWILRETCRQGREWLDMGLPAITLAVNVSAYQFLRCDITALITEVLNDTGFPVEYLELEITESGLMENQQHALSILNSLHDKGVHLAIDDFGTGYSSLAYLKHFPVDLLKIDKTFIDDIPFLAADMAITTAIIAMAHHLGFKVLAEGVETPEQLAFLQQHHCDSYQGYLYSKPLTAHAFAKLLFNKKSLFNTL